VNKIASILRELLLATPEAVVISTMRNVAFQMNGNCLQINRIVDCNGKSIGLGARPGHASIASQFSDIKSFLGNRPVILVEDGSFSGSTMIFMIKMCKMMNINIKHIVIGLLFHSARKPIMQEFPNKNNIHCCREESFVDWMPDHDFYPFVPNSGRVVGWQYNGQPMPAYLHNGLSLCMPYVKPYGDPIGWASIPEEKACNFSIFCISESIAIFEEMERINGMKITLESLIGTYPHVSLPIMPGENDFPHINTRIIDVLHSDVQVLS
jgi:hypothetical protein